MSVIEHFSNFTSRPDSNWLRQDCLMSIRQWPGCETVKEIALLRGRDGKYSFVITNYGIAEKRIADRAVRAFQGRFDVIFTAKTPIANEDR